MSSAVSELKQSATVGVSAGDIGVDVGPIGVEVCCVPHAREISMAPIARHQRVTFPNFIITHSGRGCCCLDSHSRIFEPPASPPVEQFSGIGIPIFTRPVKASGGSGEARRGIGRQNVEVWTQDKSRLRPQWKRAVLAGMVPLAGRSLVNTSAPASG